MDRRLLPCLIALAVCVLLSGCAERRWWIGTWSFDPEETSRRLAQQVDPANDGGSMIRQLGPMALRPLAGMELHFTETELITTRSGEGRARPYAIVERPDARSVILRSGDEVRTCTLEGEHLTASLIAGVSVKACFRRKP